MNTISIRIIPIGLSLLSERSLNRCSILISWMICSITTLIISKGTIIRRLKTVWAIGTFFFGYMDRRSLKYIFMM
jgi:hypothetical protein